MTTKSAKTLCHCIKLCLYIIRMLNNHLIEVYNVDSIHNGPIFEPQNYAQRPQNEYLSTYSGSVTAINPPQTWYNLVPLDPVLYISCTAGFWYSWPPQSPIDQYLTQIGPRHHKNEHVKICVGSITATDYATRTLSDCIHFHLYIMGRPSDALAACLIQSATPMGQYLTQIGHRHEYLSKLQGQSLHHHLIMPEPGRTTSIFVYILWGD